MQRIQVSSLGFDLTKEVPQTVEEYNALAPKRENAALEDAINNTLYRGTLADFRDAFLTELGILTGVARINHGTEEEPQLESEARWYKRILAANGGVVKPEWVTLAQKHMDAAAFNPAERERKSDGPAIGKRDIALAQELIKRGEGKVAEVAALLAKKLGREVATDEKSLARAFADNRRMEAEKIANAQKAEFGL